MKKHVHHLVKVKPQPRRRRSRIMYVFNINWNIFNWGNNSVKPEEDTASENEETEENASENDETEENAIKNEEVEETESIVFNIDIIWDDVLPYIDEFLQ